MEASNPWQQAWEQAQPHLKAASEALGPSRPLRQRILRVGQLDAELLDQELANLLRGPLGDALNLIHSTFKTRFEPELAFIIQLALYRLSVGVTGASYGARLQGLRYEPRIPTERGLSTRLLAVHGALTILAPYVYTRVREHALSSAWSEAPTSDPRRRAWDALTNLETVYATVALGSFITFLWNGRYRTIVDRLLGLRLVPATRLVKREVSYEFMNRQMVWHAFTEFLMFVLPLLPRRALQRSASAAVDAVSHPIDSLMGIMPTSVRDVLNLPSEPEKAASGQRRGPYWHLPETECAIEHENAAAALKVSSTSGQFNPYMVTSTANSTTDSKERPTHPLTSPYRTSCGHIYCYACVADKMLRAADEGYGPWICLRCAEPVLGIERLLVEPMYWTGDGEGDDESAIDWGSDYFDELGSSVSGVSGLSVGSRSWSEGERSE